jgi:protein-L-isoaspartate(D-aspartate) O-methyltransferase
MIAPADRSVPSDMEARLRAALHLLDGETGGNAERVEAGVREMLAGAQRDEALRVLASAWDAPEPGMRRHARRLSCEALIEEAGRGPGAANDPWAGSRLRMVRDQLFRQGIADPRVLRAMLAIPREAFVPAPIIGQAYDPNPLAIGDGQTISQPFIVAYMTEALGLRGDEKVLEVGTGSGYQAAVLSRTAREVWSIELREGLARRAAVTLARLGCANVRLRAGDGRAGWPDAAPFDAVMATCAPEAVPPALTAQLREGGRLVAPVGGAPECQWLVRVTKGRGGLQEETLIAVRFVPMTGVPGSAP